MKRVLRTALMAWLAVLLCFGMLAPAAQAAENPLQATIPIQVEMDGTTLPATDTVTATIAAVTSGAPMPTDTTINIVCNGTEKLGTGEFVIDYTTVGIYEYTVTIYGGDYWLAEYGEDLVYYVTVAVTNTEDMKSYEVTVQAHLEGQTAKAEILEDINYYYDPMTITVVKKWVDQDSSRPYYVTVNLLVDGDTIDTIKLYSSGSWQGTFENLDPRLEYEVEEEKVSGYTATYKYDTVNNIVYITNTGSLLQTGQLNWPIPVLCFCGLALVALGGVLMMRRKDENA